MLQRSSFVTKKIGQDLFETFVEERIVGDVSLWVKIKKRNLLTFKSQSKSIKTQIGAKMVQLKEEKAFVTRFLIAARKRPEIDFSECLGNFEFSVVPKSIFSPDGQPLPSNAKSKVLHHIEDINNAKKDNKIQQTQVIDHRKVIIIAQGNKNMFRYC